MAGMFYSLQEAAEKLNKTEDELRELVTEGKLREFRDGPNVLFKVEEVESLISDEDVIGLEVPEEEVPELESLTPEALEPEVPFAEAASTPAEADFETEEPTEEVPEVDVGELEIPELEALDSGIAEVEIPEAEAEEPEMAEPEVLEVSEDATGTSEILLAPETGAPVMPSDLTDADTALTGMGTSVLGETDQDYDITDDTLAETAVPTGTTPEVPLEEIEEDVNLDSFGSGSGLLDLSLQADDTSLGGILDEIYTAEGEGQEAGEVEVGSGAAMPSETDQMPTDDGLAAAQAVPDVTASALTAPLLEVPPDAQSNTLGMLLFLPLLIVIYTTVVAVAGFKGVVPSILGTVQNFIWYVMGGAAVLTALVVAAAFLFTGERGSAKTKEKKPKKAKEPKAPKVKKPKKEKKPKKAK
jgi:excisionase family DNA binding protein